MGGDNGTRAKVLAKWIKDKIEPVWRNPKVRAWILLLLFNIGAIVFAAKKGSEFSTAGTKQNVFSLLEIACKVAIDCLVIYNLSQKATDDPGSSCCMKTLCRGCSRCCRQLCSIYNLAMCVLVIVIHIVILYFHAKAEGNKGSKHKSARMFFSFWEIIFMMLLNALGILPLYLRSNGDPSLDEVGLNVI